MILRYDLLEQILAGFDLLRGRRRRWINNCRPDHLSRWIDYRKFAARPERRIPAKYHFSGNRRLHKELVQILAEHFDGPVLCLFRKLIPYFTLDRRRDQPVITVLHRLFQHRSCIRIVLMYDLLLQIAQDILFRSFHFHRQELFFLPAV